MFIERIRVNIARLLIVWIVGSCLTVLALKSSNLANEVLSKEAKSAENVESYEFGPKCENKNCSPIESEWVTENKIFSDSMTKNNVDLEALPNHFFYISPNIYSNVSRRDGRKYVYLNYKEAYGIRYDPSVEPKSPKRKHQKHPIRSSTIEDGLPYGTIGMLQKQSLENATSVGSVMNTTLNNTIDNSMTMDTMLNSTVNDTQSTVSTTTELNSIIPATTSTTTPFPFSTSTFTSATTTLMSISTTTPRTPADNDDEFPSAPLLPTDAPYVNKRPPSSVGNSTFLYRPIIPPMTDVTRPKNYLRDALNYFKSRLKQLFNYGLFLNVPLAQPQNGASRFLSLFNVIKFENIPCTSSQTMLTEMSGTCYHVDECRQMGGTAVDNCADGFGVCCVFKNGCGQVTNQMVSYFQSPNWPEASKDRIVCTLTLELQPDVLQVLIEFLTFELKAPIDGSCEDDQFIITGQNQNSPIPTMCGVNNGQHVYIDVDNSLERKLFMSVLTKSGGSRAHNIRISQLKSDLAPFNCLQYYTEPEGWIQTFNYEDASKYVEFRNPSYFNNLNYAICIKRQPDSCAVTYMNEVDDVEYDFQLLNVDSEGSSVIPPRQAGLEIFNCNDDFISVNSIRFCGEKLNDASSIYDLRLNAPVTDLSNGPIVLPVRTNDAYVGRGFKFRYRQVSCQDESAEPGFEDEEQDTIIIT